MRFHFLSPISDRPRVITFGKVLLDGAGASSASANSPTRLSGEYHPLLHGRKDFALILC
jgi:hypothetical protein